MLFSKPEILAVISALTLVIGILWKLKVNHDKEAKDRLQKYEKDFEGARDTILQLTKDYARLEGRIDGIEGLSRRVLQEIRSLKED